MMLDISPLLMRAKSRNTRSAKTIWVARMVVADEAAAMEVAEAAEVVEAEVAVVAVALATKIAKVAKAVAVVTMVAL